MDYQTEDTRYQEERYQEDQTSAPALSQPKQSPNHMATASLVMGILAVVTCCCYYGAFIFGGLGILFAILSRADEKLCGRAEAGLILSIVGIVLVVLFWVVLLWGMRTSGVGHGPIQNLPAVPDFTQPGPDNILTIFRFLTVGGGI